MTSFRGSRNRGLLALEKEAGKDDSGMVRTVMGFGTLLSPDLGVDDVFYFNSEPKSIDDTLLWIILRTLRPSDAFRVDYGGEKGFCKFRYLSGSLLILSNNYIGCSLRPWKRLYESFNIF